MAVAVNTAKTVLPPPDLCVYFQVQDSGGTWFPVLMIDARTTMAYKCAGLFLPAGPNIGGSKDYDFTPMVLPEYDRVSWNLSSTDPVFRSTVISPYGR